MQWTIALLDVYEWYILYIIYSHFLRRDNHVACRFYQCWHKDSSTSSSAEQLRGVTSSMIMK